MWQKCLRIFLAAAVFLGISFFQSGIVLAAEDTEAVKVVVTEVKQNPNDPSEFRIILNNWIAIRNIRVTKEDGQTTIKYPVYVSRTGRVYPQVKFLTEQAQKAVETAIRTKKASDQESSGLKTFKITGWFKLRGTSSRKVNAEVSFGKAVAVSCGVMEGSRGPWIAWPAHKDEESGRWVKEVYIVDPEIKRTVEKALINKYQSGGEAEEGSSKTKTGGEEW